MARLALGTRKSALALAQARWVAERLREAHPGLSVDLKTISTEGDRTQAANIPLSSFGEKGIFAKEIEAALASGAIDLAVHSMKDLAATLPEGLRIASVPLREDPRDAVVGKPLEELAAGCRIGTGSVRRAALLGALRPDLRVLDIRGNVDTRLAKLHAGEYDAVVLAVAGLIRLGRQQEIAQVLDPDVFVPDPGQGALAIQTRAEDETTNELVAILDHPASHTAILAERAFLAALGAGCQTPVGAWARLVEGQLVLTALLASTSGPAIRRHTLTGHLNEAEELGRRAASLLAQSWSG